MSEQSVKLGNLFSRDYGKKHLSSFKIQKKIGKGQFSVVYEALCGVNDKMVALKKIKIFKMKDSKSRLDCIKEINLLQQLNHPNVISYLASFIQNNNLYIVFELANAGDLSTMINYYKRKKRLLSERTIWKCFVQIMSALKYMHSKSIMHRDIKPANVFLASSGLLKLGDLGLGRFFSTKTVAAHSLVGTPYYMSPERINESGYNFKSDIWSVGCLLYEMAALQNPFFGEKMNLYTLCKKIELCDFPPLPSNIYSQKLRNLVSGCLRSEAESRPDVNYIYEISKEMNSFLDT